MESVWLIHNNIPPYRVPLFAEIAGRADFDFTVVLTAPKCRHRPHWTVDTGGLRFPVMVTKGLNVPLSDSGSLSISFGLLPSLIRHRPDIVICSGFGLSTLMVLVYASVVKRPYVVWSESTPLTERLRKMGRLRLWLRRLLARHASAFIDAGTLAREYIESLLPASTKKPFFRSYNCVDKALFSSPDNGDGREPDPVRRILFVGRLNQNKGIPMLLDVYGDVIEQTGDKVALVLVGDGPLRSMVEEFRRSHTSASVEVLGQVPYKQVASYYQKCDLFVLLSLSDCNPLVIFEALHSGIPIVCTDRAGNAPDFIVPGGNGYIVDPTNKDQILNCVMDVLAWDGEKRRRAADLSREAVSKANYAASAEAFISACHDVSSLAK